MLDALMVYDTNVNQIFSGSYWFLHYENLVSNELQVLHYYIFSLFNCFFQMQIYIFISVIVSALAAVELESRAKLLASKTVENNVLVENKELTIKYAIYNVGMR